MKKLFLLAISCIVLAGLASCNQKAANSSENTEATDATKVEQGNMVVENILNRRSIRSYKPEQITQEQLDTIVKCAINAPSAMNKQPWEVRVVQDTAVLKKIAGKANFYHAPTLIVIARDKENHYSASDCGMLAQNILLSAESMNIGTCVIGGVANAFKGDEAKELLQAINMPETHEIIYGIATGYKNEAPDAKERDANKVQIVK